LILGKISKFYATKCQILRLKCTKFAAGGAYSAPPTPKLYLRGATSKRRAGERGGEVR